MRLAPQSRGHWFHKYNRSPESVPPDYEETVIAAKRAEFRGTLFNKVIISEKARKVFGCMEAVIRGLELYMFVENKVIQKKMKMEPICSETLCTYMLKLTDQVKNSKRPP